MDVDVVPLPPLSEGLKRVIDEPWRRGSVGVRLERNAPQVIDAVERARQLEEGDG